MSDLQFALWKFLHIYYITMNFTLLLRYYGNSTNIFHNIKIEHSQQYTYTLYNLLIVKNQEGVHLFLTFKVLMTLLRSISNKVIFCAQLGYGLNDIHCYYINETKWIKLFYA
jgi:hypothetical protein